MQWTYDADSKTLTVTGDDVYGIGTIVDDAYYSSFNTISEDIENVVIKDCTLSNCFAMFAGIGCR